MAWKQQNNVQTNFEIECSFLHLPSLWLVYIQWTSSFLWFYSTSKKNDSKGYPMKKIPCSRAWKPNLPNVMSLHVSILSCVSADTKIIHPDFRENIMIGPKLKWTVAPIEVYKMAMKWYLQSMNLRVIRCNTNHHTLYWLTCMTKVLIIRPSLDHLTYLNKHGLHSWTLFSFLRA